MVVITAKEAQDMTLEARERIRKASQDLVDEAIMKFLNQGILDAIKTGASSCEIQLSENNITRDHIGRHILWTEGKGKKQVVKCVYLADIQNRLEELGYMTSCDLAWAPRMFMISWKGEQDANS